MTRRLKAFQALAARTAERFEDIKVPAATPEGMRPGGRLVTRVGDPARAGVVTVAPTVRRGTLVAERQ